MTDLRTEIQCAHSGAQTARDTHRAPPLLRGAGGGARMWWMGCALKLRTLISGLSGIRKNRSSLMQIEVRIG